MCSVVGKLLYIQCTFIHSYESKCLDIANILDSFFDRVPEAPNKLTSKLLNQLSFMTISRKYDAAYLAIVLLHLSPANAPIQFPTERHSIKAAHN